MNATTTITSPQHPASPKTTQLDFWPDSLIIDPEVAESPLAKRVIARLPAASITYEEAESDPLRTKDEHQTSTHFTEGKRTLILKRYKGTWLKACPGTSDHVCCNLLIVNPGEGCPFDCTYCYLQSYLKRNPTLKLYTNTDELRKAIQTKVEASPSRLFRVGTGEVIDSLALDTLSDLSLELVPFFARLPNALLELKTKSNVVDNLLLLRNEHRDKTIVSWSVNAREVSDKDEAYTASLDERINAAGSVIDAGYKVGLHFDPLIHFDGWRDGYRDAIRSIFQAVDSSRVAWVSISTLRYKPEQQVIMRERFPESILPLGEQFLAKDGKLRYIQPLRFQMIRFVWNELKAAASTSIPTYMCMESAAAWKNLYGSAPAAGSEIRDVFARNTRSHSRLQILNQ